MSAACKSWRLWLTLAGCLALTACALTSARTPVSAQPEITKSGNSSAAASASATAIALPAAVAPAAAAEASKPTVTAAAQKQFDTALELLKANRVSDAQQQLLSLTKSNPELAAPWINLGLIEFKANHFDAAMEYFKQAVQRDVSSAVAQNYLGMSYRNLGQFKQAEAAYQAAIAANANYALAHFNLGVLYDLYLQQPEQALQQYENFQALQGTPDSKVTGWIKELKGRLGSKAKTAESQS